MNLNFQYDAQADVLYCSFGEPQEALCEELADGIIARKHPETDALVGLTVVDFRRRFLREPSATVSIPLDAALHLSR